jgi:hypothetical protein
MTKEIPNDEAQIPNGADQAVFHSSFVIASSFVIRHSSFPIVSAVEVH